jgi:phage terminase large subunit-like protein
MNSIADSSGLAADKSSTLDLSKLSREQKLKLLTLLEEKERRASRNKISTLYCSEGPYRRELYSKHTEFFKLGATYNERALFGGNRSGKTLAGCYEDALHLTGQYPDWWEGWRVDHPVDAWCAGDTAKTVRDILQRTLVGPPGDPDRWGTGLIPGDSIVRTTPKHGLADAIESIYVRHASGGLSSLQFKSYDQGRESFQGTEQHYIHLDEDCSQEVYVECLLRLMTTSGRIIWTATLVEGVTPLMLDFLPAMRPTPD